MYSQERLFIIKLLKAKQIKYMTMLVIRPHYNGKGMKKREQKPIAKTKNNNFI